MVSKTLSLGIIVASSIIKLPQILKIVNAASAQVRFRAGAARPGSPTVAC